MEPFDMLTSIAAPIDTPNVDTDQLIPIHRLHDMRLARGSFGSSLFYDHRFDSHGAKRADFILNRPEFGDARILVTSDNFGCGSSREAAVWALRDFGIRALIGPRFGDIFRENCTRNGLLVVEIAAEKCALLRQMLHDQPGTVITVNLPRQEVRAGQEKYSFPIGAFCKALLTSGMDEIGFTLKALPRIEAWEDGFEAECPWS
jgi:3-isopropylmalate/(R)-2-methylmalate dehydratase small subunit